MDETRFQEILEQVSAPAQVIDLIQSQGDLGTIFNTVLSAMVAQLEGDPKTVIAKIKETLEALSRLNAPPPFASPEELAEFAALLRARRAKI